MWHIIMFSLHSLNYTAANLSNMSLKFTCSVVAKKAPLKVSCRVTLTFFYHTDGACGMLAVSIHSHGFFPHVNPMNTVFGTKTSSGLSSLSGCRK